MDQYNLTPREQLELERLKRANQFAPFPAPPVEAPPHRLPADPPEDAKAEPEPEARWITQPDDVLQELRERTLALAIGAGKNGEPPTETIYRATEFLRFIERTPASYQHSQRLVSL